MLIIQRPFFVEKKRHYESLYQLTFNVELSKIIIGRICMCQSIFMAKQIKSKECVADHRKRLLLNM